MSPSSRFDLAQLETLVAVVDEGTFDAAAQRLRVTPSAVSQRIRALEQTAGQVLIQRSTPCSATEAGLPILRLGRQLRLLTQEAIEALSDSAELGLTVSVNADSLQTWFRHVLSAAAHWKGISLRLVLTEERGGHERLRSGEVLAAVTTAPRPVQGCSVKSLGAMRYSAVCAPHLLTRDQQVEPLHWESMPVVTFSNTDELHAQVLAQRGHPRPRTVHRVPTSAGLHEAVRFGLGWGVLPEQQVADDVATGALVMLPDADPVDVPLFWQQWRLDSAALGRLTRAVQRAARALT